MATFWLILPALTSISTLLTPFFFSNGPFKPYFLDQTLRIAKKFSLWNFCLVLKNWIMTCVSSICMYELRCTHIGTHFFCRQAAAVIFLWRISAHVNMAFFVHFCPLLKSIIYSRAGLEPWADLLARFWVWWVRWWGVGWRDWMDPRCGCGARVKKWAAPGMLGTRDLMAIDSGCTGS